MTASAAQGIADRHGHAPGASEDDLLIHRYLLAAAEERPQAPALDGPRGMWTYRELQRTAEECAEQLLDHGLRSGDRLLLELHPCPEAVALILAAASLGVVFVSVSPELPARRQQQIYRDVEAAAVVGLSPHWDDVGPVVLGRLTGEGRLALSGNIPGTRPQSPPTPDSLAYVVFTSGSTGVPKGIMMTHSAVVSFWTGFQELGVAPDVRLGTVAPLQFDFSLLDLGMALGDGGCLVQVPSLLLQQPSGFTAFLRRHAVTQMNGVPSIWREMLRDAGTAAMLADTALGTVLYAGEAFPLGQLRTLRQVVPRVRIVNGFGHSESIACAYNILPEPIPHIDGRIPFGTQAIKGLRMAVLGDDLRPAGPHEVGELYVEGEALFSGYWNDPAGTAAALVDSPMTPGRRAFRSGDLVFRDEAGQHYFHSRRDSQVKIAGNRVELGEVDNHLQRHPWVRDAACVLCQAPRQGQGAAPQLVAFVCLTPAAPSGSGERDGVVAALRSHCAEVLARYARPSRYELVAQLPLSRNGKIDRAELTRIAAGRAAR